MTKKTFSWLLVIGLLALVPRSTLAQVWQSAIVQEDASGQLVYVEDAEGNRIPDFSNAGYRGGGVDLPDYPIETSIGPIDGDNTAHIQSAIDAISSLRVNDDGIRGALLLEAGVYRVSESLRLVASGVVIRGVGSETDSTSNTIIRRRGNSEDAVLLLGGGGSTDAWQEESNTRSDIVTDWVKVGDRSFEVATPSLFNLGDQILITQPTTTAWLDAIDGGGTASDPNWDTDEFDIVYTRRIEAIQGSEIQVDAPVFNHLDRSLSQSYIARRDSSGQIEELGIENLRIEIETEGPTSENHARSAIEFLHVANGWVDHVSTSHFVYAGVDIRNSIHITVQNSEAIEPHSLVDGARRYNFAVYRSQLVLFQNNYASEARHAYVGNGEAWDSGIVFLNNVSENASTSSEPHRHWGQGFLYDNHLELGSSLRQLRLRLGNRGDFGTGHGWSAVHSVAWNCKMNGTSVSVEKPPTAQNYGIGCEGNVRADAGSFNQPAGYIEGSNQPGLHPYSLYLKQLADRLGRPFETSHEIPKLDSNGFEISNFPNPFSKQTMIRIGLSEASELDLSVYDALGRQLRILEGAYYSKGVHHFEFNQELRTGIYFLRMETAEKVVNSKMIVID